MRAYDCVHENEDNKVYKITGADDGEVFTNLKTHLAEYHMDLSLSDDQIRDTIREKAYDE